MVASEQRIGFGKKLAYFSTLALTHLFPINFQPRSTSAANRLNKAKIAAERKVAKQKSADDKRMKVEEFYAGKDGLVKQYGTTFGWQGGMRGRVNLEGRGLVEGITDELREASRGRFANGNTEFSTTGIVDVQIDLKWAIEEVSEPMGVVLYNKELTTNVFYFSYPLSRNVELLSDLVCN